MLKDFLENINTIKNTNIIKINLKKKKKKRNKIIRTPLYYSDDSDDCDNLDDSIQSNNSNILV